jgi:hypothetical protein
MSDETARAKLEAEVARMQQQQRDLPPAERYRPDSYVYIAMEGAKGAVFVDSDGSLNLLGSAGEEQALAIMALARELGKLDADARERIATLLRALEHLRVADLLELGNLVGWAKVHADVRAVGENGR